MNSTAPIEPMVGGFTIDSAIMTLIITNAFILLDRVVANFRRFRKSTCCGGSSIEMDPATPRPPQELEEVKTK